MQNEITQVTPLLKNDGTLTEAGWARQPFWQYRRAAVKAPWFRKKEWDYYYLLSDDMSVGVSITISDLGYAGLMAICWLDFATQKSYQCDAISLLPRGRLGLDEDSISSSVCFSNKDMSIEYQCQSGSRSLVFSAPNLMVNGHKGLTGELLLSENPDADSLNIATSWPAKLQAFYYNRKINGLLAQGQVSVAGQVYDFRRDNCFGGLDWGRGNWTYKNRWFWASANTLIDGKMFGMNLGYGFSDRTPASENVIFYDGVAHKIDNIEFHFNGDDYLQGWQTISDDGRLKLTFEPLLDRASASNLILIKSQQHQVFGYFDGEFLMDDGRVIKIERMLGFAEDVLNYF